MTELFQKFSKLNKTNYILNAQLEQNQKIDLSFIKNTQYFVVKWYIICGIIYKEKISKIPSYCNKIKKIKI